MKPKYHYKKLLNLLRFHSVAAISINLEIEAWNNNAVGGNITISDCNRTITLDLDCHDHLTKTNILRKIDTIVQGLSEAREWIEKQDLQKQKDNQF